MKRFITYITEVPNLSRMSKIAERAAKGDRPEFLLWVEMGPGVRVPACPTKQGMSQLWGGTARDYTELLGMNWLLLEYFI